MEASTVYNPEKKSGALDDLERALNDQAEAIDRLRVQLTGVVDPRHFEVDRIVEVAPQEEPRLRVLIARAAENTERLHRLAGDVDV